MAETAMLGGRKPVDRNPSDRADEASPALEAWQTLSLPRPQLERAEPVQRKKRKAEVWRLSGPQADDGVFAKRCRLHEVAREEIVYRNVLPRIGMETAQYLGSDRCPTRSSTKLQPAQYARHVDRQRPRAQRLRLGAAEWGVPARDLVKLVSPSIAGTVAAYWRRCPDVAASDRDLLFGLGRLFRAVEHLTWVAPRLRYALAEEPMRRAAAHGVELLAARNVLHRLL